MRFVLYPYPSQSRLNCVQAIHNAPDGYVVTIEEPDKTPSQRGLFHLLCDALGQEIGMRPGDIKELAKAQIFGYKTVKLGGIELTVADGSSEGLGKKGYGQLIDVVYQMAAEAGVILPMSEQ